MPEWLSHKCNNLFTEEKVISSSLEFWLVLRKESFDSSSIRTCRLLHCNSFLRHQSPNISHKKSWQVDDSWVHAPKPIVACKDTGDPQRCSARQPQHCSPEPMATAPCGDTIHCRSSLSQLNSLFKSYSASIFFLPRHEYFKTENKPGSQLKLTSPMS